MTRDIRARFIAIVLLTVVAAGIVAPIPGKSEIPVLSKTGIRPGMDLAGGAELRYKLLFPPGFSGDREHAARQTAEILRRRLETRLLQEPKITTHGGRGIVLQLPGIDAEGLRDCKRLIETMGNLELHATASRDLQGRYDESRVIPAGCTVVRTRDGAELLIEERPVIEGRHVINAEALPEMLPGGVRWDTSFELDAEGARRFDEAAERLHQQRPPGRIVVLLDGEVKSAPVVQSPSFHGRGRISGAKDQKEAKDLAIILRSGSLPAPIGSEEER